MNKVEAFIRPEKLDNAKDALANEGILGLSVIQVTVEGSRGASEPAAEEPRATWRACFTSRRSR